MSPTSYQTAPPRDKVWLEARRMISSARTRVKEPAQLTRTRFYFRVVTVARMAVRRSAGMSSISTAEVCWAMRMVSR
jgi:hypothetical protein